MDPEACLELILDAIEANDKEAIHSHFSDLIFWLDHNGFAPCVTDRVFKLFPPLETRVMYGDRVGFTRDGDKIDIALFSLLHPGKILRTHRLKPPKEVL